MKFKFLKAIFVGLVLSANNLANAGIIQSDFLTVGDELAVYDESTNLTWLDLSLTKGMTYDLALSTYGNFRYANDTDVINLFTNFFGAITYKSNGTSASSLGPDFVSMFHNASGWSYAYGFFYDDNSKYALAGATNSGNVYGPDYNHDYGTYVTSGNGSVGVYMVMDGRIALKDDSHNEVPEPSTLAILALGMIGLASRRFKKQS